MSAVAGTEAPVVTGAIMFTDIVGFTEYTALQGDDEAVRLLATQERLVYGALPTGARVVKEIGDGLLMWFPDSASALRTAFELNRSFDRHVQAGGVPLWVRMGMHHGTARRRGDDLVGHDVNLAARIVDVAGPGEVVLSEATKSDIGDRVPDASFDELGPVVMKGIPDPVRLWRATPDDDAVAE
jgi:adenylate cyclase